MEPYSLYSALNRETVIWDAKSVRILHTYAFNDLYSIDFCPSQRHECIKHIEQHLREHGNKDDRSVVGRLSNQIH